MSDNMDRRRALVLQTLRDADWPLTVREIAQDLQRPVNTVRGDLDVLTTEGKIQRAGISTSGAQCWTAATPQSGDRP
jgi:predicted ArsR family transcriptional regulator